MNIAISIIGYYLGFLMFATGICHHDIWFTGGGVFLLSLSTYILKKANEPTCSKDDGDERSKT